MDSWELERYMTILSFELGDRRGFLPRLPTPIESEGFRKNLSGNESRGGSGNVQGNVLYFPDIGVSTVF